MTSLVLIPMRFFLRPWPKMFEAGFLSTAYAKIHTIVFCDDRFLFSSEEKKVPLKQHPQLRGYSTYSLYVPVTIVCCNFVVLVINEIKKYIFCCC